ncbi:MAG: NTP transferase domain-containing protein [Fuerstiella sp.]|nr:NTP transferase domain-containing protein [Fuerstiella sp.]
MGRPKLLLPWEHWTLIDQLLYAWTNSTVDHVVVVVRSDDEELQSVCARWPVHTVKPTIAPNDMKESVRIGLQFLDDHWRPTNEDGCFVAPADLPGLNSAVIDGLIEAGIGATAITVPRFGRRRGHPALFPWSVTSQIFDLPQDQGVNQVVEQNPQHIVDFPAEDYFPDMDTPEEYRSMLESQKDQSRDRASDVQEHTDEPEV